MSIRLWYRRLLARRRSRGDLAAGGIAADAGDADFQFSRGLRYSAGNGESVDLEEAAQWYRKAADQGHALAQYNLSVMFATGQGVPLDDVEAERWTRRAAEGGDAGAQFELGSRCHRNSLVFNGGGGVESRIEAYKWLCLSAAQGYRGSVAAWERVALSMSRDELADGNRRVAVFETRKPAEVAGNELTSSPK